MRYSSDYKILGTEQVPPSSGGILSLGMTVPLPLTVELIKAKLLTEVYSVRIHSRIARNPWARLWYLCRGIDKDGSGQLKIPLSVIEAFLDCKEKTIYQWLKDGKRVGAFRRYRSRKGVLQIYLGSLYKVCWELNLKNWGAVGVHPLSEVNAHIRATTTGIITQQLQQKSRYAADQKLKPQHRKYFGTPHPNSLMKSVGQSSPKFAVGEVPRVLHISESRIFVSKNFTVFGTSQATIAKEFYINPVTVQRHHARLGTTRRQLCQKKGEYAHVKRALDYGSDDFQALDPMGSGQYTDVGFKITGDKTVFNDGVPLGCKKKTPNSYATSADGLNRRIFTIGKKKWKTTWLAKCNIYAETYTLTTMRAARRKFRYNLSRGIYDNCHKGECTKKPESGAVRLHQRL